jgi:hypothetical protein
MLSGDGRRDRRWFAWLHRISAIVSAVTLVPRLAGDTSMKAFVSSHDFKLRGPFDKYGLPVDLLIGNTGKFEFRFKSPSSAEIATPTEPVARNSEVGGRKPCCNSCH